MLERKRGREGEGDEEDNKPLHLYLKILRYVHSKVDGSNGGFGFLILV